MIRSFICDFDCSESGVCEATSLIQKLSLELGIPLEGKDQLGNIQIVHEPHFHILIIDFQKTQAPQADVIRPIIFTKQVEIKTDSIPQEKQSFFDKMREFFRL